MWPGPSKSGPSSHASCNSMIEADQSEHLNQASQTGRNNQPARGGRADWLPSDIWKPKREATRTNLPKLLQFGYLRPSRVDQITNEELVTISIKHSEGEIFLNNAIGFKREFVIMRSRPKAMNYFIFWRGQELRNKVMRFIDDWLEESSICFINKFWKCRKLFVSWFLLRVSVNNH